MKTTKTHTWLALTLAILQAIQPALADDLIIKIHKPLQLTRLSLEPGEAPWLGQLGAGSVVKIKDAKLVKDASGKLDVEATLRDWLTGQLHYYDYKGFRNVAYLPVEIMTVAEEGSTREMTAGRQVMMALRHLRNTGTPERPSVSFEVIVPAPVLPPAPEPSTLQWAWNGVSSLVGRAYNSLPSVSDIRDGVASYLPKPAPPSAPATVAAPAPVAPPAVAELRRLSRPALARLAVGELPSSTAYRQAMTEVNARVEIRLPDPEPPKTEPGKHLPSPGPPPVPQLVLEPNCGITAADLRLKIGETAQRLGMPAHLLVAMAIQESEGDCHIGGRAGNERFTGSPSIGLFQLQPTSSGIDICHPIELKVPEGKARPKTKKAMDLWLKNERARLARVNSARYRACVARLKDPIQNLAAAEHDLNQKLEQIRKFYPYIDRYPETRTRLLLASFNAGDLYSRNAIRIAAEINGKAKKAVYDPYYWPHIVAIKLRGSLVVPKRVAEFGSDDTDRRADFAEGNIAYVESVFEMATRMGMRPSDIGRNGEPAPIPIGLEQLADLREASDQEREAYRALAGGKGD